MFDILIQWKGDTALSTNQWVHQEKRSEQRMILLISTHQIFSLWWYVIRGRKPTGRPSKASLLICSSSSIPSCLSTKVKPRAPSPLSWEWCQRLRQPLRVSECTWCFVLKEEHWQRSIPVPKKVLFPIVLDWQFHSAPLLSLWISFLNYFRFVGAE